MRDFGLGSEITWRLPEGQETGASPDLADSGMDDGEEAADGSGPELDDDLPASTTEPPRLDLESAEVEPPFSGGSGGGTFSPGWVLGGLSDAGPPEHEMQHWSVPWSDLMMVMFVMFAVITTTQLTPAPEEPATTEEVEARDRVVRPFGDPIMTINVMERAQRVVRDSDAQDVDIVLMEDQSVKVSVQGPMLFNAGSADLRPEVTGFLDQLASIIRETPYLIEIIGHTDDLPVSTPLFPSNWELSTARASRVARYLIQSGRIAASRFTVIGRAQYEPAVANETTVDRSRNRRVEILITRDVLPTSEVAINE